MTLRNTSLTLFLLLLAILPAAAQKDTAAQQRPAVSIPDPATYPTERDMARGNYGRALARIEKRLAKDSSDVLYTYAAYQLYSDTAFSGFDFDRAYAYLAKVQRLFIHAAPKQLDRLARNNFCGALLDYDLSRVCRMAMHAALRTHTLDSYDHFLNTCLLAPQEQRDSVAASRDTLEYAQVCRIGDLASLQDYIDSRPNSRLRSDAVARRNSLAFHLTDSLHTIAAYEAFCRTYPGSAEARRAADSLQALTFREAAAQDGELYYRDYVLRYPDSPWAEKAEWLADSIEFFHEVDTANWPSYLYYLDNHPDRKWWSREAVVRLARFALSHRIIEVASTLIARLDPADTLIPRLSQMLRSAYLHTSAKNYPAFYERYGYLFTPEQQQDDEAAYRMSHDYDYSESDIFIHTVAPAHEAFLMLQQLLKDDIDYRRWETARNRALEYAEAFGDNYDYACLLATLAAPEQQGISSSALPSSVNSSKGDEYSPVVSSDERTLYFAGRKRPDNLGGEDVFAARRNAKGQWGNAKLVMDLSHVYGNEAPVSLSPDGRTLLLFQGGALYQAEQGAKGWQQAVRLSDNVNGSTCHPDACLAAGTVLIFSAVGRTEREVDSSLNLYVSLLDSTGRWSVPVELGLAVNTPFDERSPMLHPDMRTLYFSSEGHGSLGQMDVFVTHRIGDGWTHWTKPANLGKEVNTTENDWGYKVTVDGRHAYYARRQGLSQDICCTGLPDQARPNPVTTVSGCVKDSLGRGVAAELWCTDGTGVLVGRCKSAPGTGRYVILLPQDGDYELGLHDARYVRQHQSVDLRHDPPSAIKIDFFARPDTRRRR